MIKKLFFLIVMATTIISCQFTETMVLNEDGSGRMSIELNMDDFMAMGGSSMDSVATKIDTTVYMKELLKEKKDSISQLPKAEQDRLKKMENFNIHIKMDTETSEMGFDVHTDFRTINEANDLMNGITQAGNLMPSDDEITSDDNQDEAPSDVIGVSYSFKNGVFKRDAYVKDEKLHKQQLDSLKSTEDFLTGMNYTLSYTFPRPVKNASNAEASLSLDGKTITVVAGFIDYMKDPDLLDLEVELER